MTKSVEWKKGSAGLIGRAGQGRMIIAFPDDRVRMRYPAFPYASEPGKVEETAEIGWIFLESTGRGR